MWKEKHVMLSEPMLKTWVEGKTKEKKHKFNFDAYLKFAIEEKENHEKNILVNYLFIWN